MLPQNVIPRDSEVPWTAHPPDRSACYYFLSGYVKSKLFIFKPRTIEKLKADSHIPCRAHTVPLPCRATKDLECVFPIWFTQCGRVWFTRHIFMNQTRPHCVNQMGKTHSKSLAAWHGRGTAWARHAMCESALRRTIKDITTAVPQEMTHWVMNNFRGILQQYMENSGIY
jgi:hypothetical protein